MRNSLFGKIFISQFCKPLNDKNAEKGDISSRLNNKNIKKLLPQELFQYSYYLFLTQKYKGQKIFNYMKELRK